MINNRFLYFKSRAAFDKQKDNISDKSIVVIADDDINGIPAKTGTLYMHGLEIKGVPVDVDEESLTTIVNNYFKNND